MEIQSITTHEWRITFFKGEDSSAIASLVKSSQRTADLPLMTQVSAWEHEPTMFHSSSDQH